MSSSMAPRTQICQNTNGDWCRNEMLYSGSDRFEKNGESFERERRARARTRVCPPALPLFRERSPRSHEP